MDIRTVSPEAVEGVAWIAAARSHSRASSMVVVTESDEVVGVASWYDGTLHASRIWLSVDVAPDYRRQGVGTALVRALSRETGDPRPCAVKVDAGSEGAAFLKSLGASPYQTCPPAVVPVPTVEDTRRLTTAPGDSLLFVDMYEWVHEDWSSISSRVVAFETFEPDLRESLDLATSSFAVDDDGSIVAGAWIFEPSSVGDPLEGVAETRRLATPRGQELLSAAVGDALHRAASRGATQVSFDCHASDPHLQPILAETRGISGHEVLLMELAR